MPSYLSLFARGLSGLNYNIVCNFYHSREISSYTLDFTVTVNLSLGTALRPTHHSVSYFSKKPSHKKLNCKQ